MSAFRNFILTLLMSLVIFGLLAYGIVKYTTRSFRIGVIEEGTNGREGVVTDDKGHGSSSGAELSGLSGKSYTILFAGTDYLPSVFDDYDVSKYNETVQGFPVEPRKVKTDLLIVVHVNKEKGDTVFCAIPAATRIQIDGLNSRLEDLYAAKGAETLAAKVSALTGINVDYYAIVSADKFPSLISALGGVTYYVSTDMVQNDPEKGLNINLKKGSQKLNGQKALDMLRYSGYSDGDVSRRKCAVSFLKVVLKNELTAANASNPARFYSRYANFFETNLTLDAFNDQAELVFAYSRMNLIEYTFPGSQVSSGDGIFFNPNITKATEYFSQYKYQG